ncbi:MAG: prephenate dehydrogenase/arogenate dehydrogenase family protein [Ideonella sp.]
MQDSSILSFKKLCVIGCGLIGGSFALAMKAAGLVDQVVGVGKSADNLAKAKARGAIDSEVGSAAQGVVDADLVLVAVPVVAAESVLREIRESLSPDVLLMDVGSTKRDIVDAARRVLQGRLPNFVPAHPIAGKESSGISHAEATLFRDRQVLLTPISQTDPRLLKIADSLWSAIGGQVRQMTPENHDATFAAVSHLPHLLAFAYFNSVLGHPAGADYLQMAGPGFRDFTRIAASDPDVWRDILWTNREEVLKQSMRFRQALDAFEHVIRRGDQSAIETLIRTASDGRAEWSIANARTRSGR